MSRDGDEQEGYFDNLEPWQYFALGAVFMFGFWMVALATL